MIVTGVQEMYTNNSFLWTRRDESDVALDSCCSDLLYYTIDTTDQPSTSRPGLDRELEPQNMPCNYRSRESTDPSDQTPGRRLTYLHYYFSTSTCSYQTNGRFRPCFSPPTLCLPFLKQLMDFWTIFTIRRSRPYYFGERGII